MRGLQLLSASADSKTPWLYSNAVQHSPDGRPMPASLPHRDVLIAACLTLSVLAGFAPTAAARVILTCEDTEGNRTFSERCPPGSRQVEERRVSTGAGAPPPPTTPPGQEIKGEGLGVRQVKAVTVYVAPNCAPCDVMEAHLKKRSVVYSRVDVEADPAAFEAIKPRLPTVGVPVFLLGERLVSGYTPGDIDAALVAEGVLLSSDIPGSETTPEKTSPDAVKPGPDAIPAGTKSGDKTPTKPEKDAPAAKP
jgi:glutaredoxin